MRIFQGVLAIFLFGATLFAQSRSRIAGPVDESSLMLLPRTTHRAIQTAQDSGPVPPDFRLERMQLILSSSPEQLAALDQLLRDQQNPASPSYHQWLTPAQFGERFGPTAEELQTVTAWLRDRGFTVEKTASGRRAIEFGGTAGQVAQAFHTTIHRYTANGKPHIANSTDVSLPTALASVVTGIVSLHDFRARPQHHVLAAAEPGGNSVAPAYNSSTGVHSLTPYDFAAIYDVTPVWGTLGVDGTGQSIAVISRSNLSLSDINSFRNSYGLSPSSVNIVLNGSDPGIVTDDDIEVSLDTEWSGAVAKGATVNVVISKSTATSDGVNLSSMYAVDNNVAPVITYSYGSCEADNGSFNSYYNNLWQQAAAQGISVFVSAGDSGSAGCDDPNTAPARGPFGVNGLGSTPYNVSVGGTEFNENGNDASYWATSNTPSTLASAMGYIPEVVWNESSYTTPSDPNNGLWAGGGGVSIVYATPSWQTGPGVPASDPGSASSHHRYLPDVSLTAAQHDGYRVRAGGVTYLVSGTSASTPTFAGIMTLINQYTHTRNGNPAPQLYALAQSGPAIFHDTTSGTNAVPCSKGGPFSGGGLNCTGPPLVPSVAGVATMGGYNAGTGYDLATGLGSVDAYQLVTNWTASPSGNGGGGNGGGDGNSGGGDLGPPPPGAVSLSGAHLATGGGWETSIELINPTGTLATAYLRIYDDNGKALAIPLVAADGSINNTVSGLDQLLPPHSVQILQSAAPATTPVKQGSIEVTSDANIGGFVIFRWTLTGEEVLVPLSSGAASSYTLPFDNTFGLATGISLASSAAQPATVAVTARDQNGLVLVANSAITLPSLGHQSFVLSTEFQALANTRGTVEFTPPAGAQISVIGIRATSAGAFTGIPVLGGGATGGGILADLAAGGGWQTLIELVNTSSSAAQASFQLTGDDGSPLTLPLTSPDFALPASVSSVNAPLPSFGTDLIQSASAAGTALQGGSAVLTSGSGVTGFLIFQYTVTGQEVLVPVETGSAAAYVAAFDQTNGLVTGISLSNATTSNTATSNAMAKAVDISVILRDQTGATFATGTINLPPQGHQSFFLTDLFPAAAGKYGTVEFDPPLGGQIGVVGIRATPAGALTSVPILTP